MVRPVIYNDFCTLSPKSQNDPMVSQYAHSGIRVRPKTKKNDKFEKTEYIPQGSSPDSKADFPEKSKFGVWRLVLSRYDIVLNIQHIALIVQIYIYI